MRKHALKLMSLLSIALAAVLFAPQRATADDDDPPSRVARLGYTHGDISFQPSGTDDWVTAVVNRPMTTGDKLWVDGDGRAELNLGSASLRLAGNTGFSFLNLTDDITQLRLTEGTLRIRVKRLDENETFEIDTPNLAFSVLRAGIYKINVNDAGDTTVVEVRGGEGEVTGGGSAYTIHAGEVGTFNGGDELSADVQSYRNRDDDFDRWCADRDHREDHSVSARYVSTDAIGYEDLDDYGGWRPVPEYGTVWFPHTSVVGWAPYHYGHWAYIAPWGYTWVDDAPWGFAPFHYGRWVTVGGVWGWVPCAPRSVVIGAVYVRPVYAPALVAWVGGAHFGVGIAVGGGGGNVGWFPLGPREVYVPSYHVSRNYVNNVNVSNTTVNTTVVNNYYNNTVINKNVNVTNVTYINQRVPGALSATTPQAFTSAQSVSRNSVRIDAREAAAAPVNVTAPAVAPERRAVLGSGAESAKRPPAVLQNRQVVARVAPPPAPVPFSQQRQAIEANGGRPPAISQVRQMQPEQAARPNIRMAPPVRTDARQNVQTNRPGQPQNPGTPQNTQMNRTGQPQNNVDNRPNVPNNAPQQANRPGNPPPDNGAGNHGNAKAYNDRPPAARPPTPAAPVNPRLDQKQDRQLEQMRQKQDQERQKVEQQQQRQSQQIQQRNADEQRRQQAEQKHSQQLQQLEQKHEQQQQQLQQKQQQERQKSQPKQEQKPKNKDEKPPKR